MLCTCIMAGKLQQRLFLYVTERGYAAAGVPAQEYGGTCRPLNIGFGGTRIASMFACHGWSCSLSADHWENGSLTH
ncbi:hypothetical protein AMELA_G00279200 [Ameiurus melas]|uniref:Uncharacterized protein n=1 Tax=Ameiurus melas TaxID=219545 RepID=A0A7J5ZMB0_AMEME|nr:hypothetical protein AMELA_G00279200 [Ameiurus melas]